MRDGDPAQVTPAASAEHQWYARLLWWGGSGGLLILVVAFALYLVGVLPPLIDVGSLPRAWTLSARELGAQTGHPTGWDWLGLLHHSDIFNLVGIAVLASCSIVPLAAVAVLYWRSGERTYALLAAAQVLVLVLAASGLIGTGH